jgi:hypothetical protein
MQSHTEQTDTFDDTSFETNFATLLQGFRFKVCETPEEVAEALEVRRQVYCVDGGYSIACPDEYDHRSWILRAEEIATGRCVGTMRLTPRFAGSFEAEEYFTLPRQARASRNLEITRFAILPEFRRDKLQMPAVAFGLFRLCFDMFQLVGSERCVVSSKPERSWTYTAMGFEQTGDVVAYAKLNGAVHELLILPFHDVANIMRENPFKILFVETDFPEVIVPNRRPPLGLVPDTREFRFAVGA